MAYSATLSLLSILPAAEVLRDDDALLAKRLRPKELRPKELRKAARRGEPIHLGDLYDRRPAAGSRALLASFSRLDGLDLSIATRSPHILGDLDLLAELDRRHSVTVQMKMTACAPEPAALYAVERLAAEGIATAVLVACPEGAPAEADLRRLFAAARDAGAYDVLADEPGRRARGDRRQERFLALFRRLRLEHGFPRPVPGRG